MTEYAIYDGRYPSAPDRAYPLEIGSGKHAYRAVQHWREHDAYLVNLDTGTNLGHVRDLAKLSKEGFAQLLRNE